MEFPTIKNLCREYGLNRAALSILLLEHDIPITKVGPTKIVKPEGMTTLLPILEKLKGRLSRRRRRPKANVEIA